MKPYLLVAAALMIGPVAHAQRASEPSADELINMLKPKTAPEPAPTSMTRGIRALNTAPPATESATPVAARTSMTPPGRRASPRSCHRSRRPCE